MSDAFVERHLDQAVEIIRRLDRRTIQQLVEGLARVRERGGRVFVLGVGGSAANASHLVNDLRKLCAIEAYTPTDNVSELTARINDEGWATCLAAWLRGSRLGPADAVLVLSVGGGDTERNVSPNLVEALRLARNVGAAIFGIVGRDGGYTARVADACVVVPVVDPASVTPHTEAFQSVIAHLLVSHPVLQRGPARWESLPERSAGGSGA